MTLIPDLMLVPSSYRCLGPRGCRRLSLFRAPAYSWSWWPCYHVVLHRRDVGVPAEPERQGLHQWQCGECLARCLQVVTSRPCLDSINANVGGSLILTARRLARGECRDAPSSSQKTLAAER